VESEESRIEFRCSTFESKTLVKTWKFLLSEKKIYHYSGTLSLSNVLNAY